MAAFGLRAPLTTARLRNMLTEYLYDTSPIEALHGRTRIDNAEGVRRTSAWLTQNSSSRASGSETDTPTA